MKKEKVKALIMTEYERECKEVAQNYPLVYAALVMRARDNEDSMLVSPESFADTVLSDAAVKIAIHFAQCRSHLNRDLGMAQNASEVNSAFNNFFSCIRSPF